VLRALAAAGTAAAAATIAVSVAQAAKPTDAMVLAAHLKTSIQATYRHKVPGLLFTNVTCALPSGATKGRCKAHFELQARRLKGVFRVTATVDRSNGGVHWKATSAACRDVRTGKPVKC
jgi:hypothetical protein